MYFLLSGIIESKFRGKKLANKIICVAILIALCNTVADPIVYALRGDEFFKAFKEMLRQISSKGPMRTLSTVLSRRIQRTHVEMTETPLGTPKASPRPSRNPSTQDNPAPCIKLIASGIST